jgi:hypothetical protein
MKRHLRYAFGVAALLIAIFQFHLVSAQSCTGFRTLTQKKWGANPNGNNPAVYLHANFAAAFPNGLTIGCGANTLTLTDAQAITDFLPCGSSPSLLSAGAMIDPGSSYNNRFAAHLVTAVLNAGFDSYDLNFSPNSQPLGSLTIISGPFAGWTVSQLLAEANQTIGGCSNAYSLYDLNKALVAFNTNYPDSTSNNGYLSCSAKCSLSIYSIMATNVSCNGCTDGTIDVTLIGAQGNVNYFWNNGASTAHLSGLAVGMYVLTATDEANCSVKLSDSIGLPMLKISEVASEIPGSVSIFPNPSSDQFVIAVQTDNNSIKKLSVEIDNMMGQAIYFTPPQVFSGSLKIPVDLSEFANGIYITRVTIDEKGFFNQLVIHH